MSTSKKADPKSAFEETSRVITRLSTHLCRCIVPLFGETASGKPKLVGNGFLVSSGENAFLISAAHVFDELKYGRELFYYIEPKAKRKLSGSLRLTIVPKGKDRKSDRLDVGVLKLEGPGLPPYPKVEKYPLPIGALSPNAMPREGKHYLILGFPESKSRANPVERHVASEPYGLWDMSAELSKYAALGVTPEHHIVLNFDRTRMLGPTATIRAFPDPSGMSGSPVWMLYDNGGPNDPSQTPVVGVAIEHHKTHHAVVATDIRVALRMIDGIL